VVLGFELEQSDSILNFSNTLLFCTHMLVMLVSSFSSHSNLVGRDHCPYFKDGKTEAHSCFWQMAEPRF
jgi:hypothetical protein